MKKELLVQGILLAAAALLVLIAFLAMRDNVPTETVDDSLAEWLRDVGPVSGPRGEAGGDPIRQMTPAPGMETTY